MTWRPALVDLDPALHARIRLAALPEGAPVRLAGRHGLYQYLNLDDGRVRLRSPNGVELLAGPCAVEIPEAASRAAGGPESDDPGRPDPTPAPTADRSPEPSATRRRGARRRRAVGRRRAK